MTTWTQNRLLMTLVFVGFAIVSIAMVTFGDRSQKWVGLAALAMFGGGGAAWWMGEFRSARAAPPRLDTVRLPPGNSSPALVLPMKAGKQRSAVLAQAAFSAGSLVFALSPERLGDRDGPLVRIVLLVVGLFLAVTALRSAWGWARREFFLALTPSGLLVRTITGGNFIPWHAVTGLSVFPLYGEPFLGIDVSDLHAIQREGVLGSLDRLDRQLTGRDRSVWLGGFASRPDSAEQLIRDYFEFPEKRAGLGRDPVPAVLLRPAERVTHAITEEEKRHARSVGRWISALLLVLYGGFVCAIAVGAGVELAEAAPESSRRPLAVAVSFLLVLVVLLVGLAHFAAAAAIVVRREIGRRAGKGLSGIGIAIGGLLVVAILLADMRNELSALTLAVLVIGAYALLLVMLLLTGRLTDLQSPATDGAPTEK